MRNHFGAPWNARGAKVFVFPVARDLTAGEFTMDELFQRLGVWGWTTAYVIVAILAGLLAHSIAYWLLKRFASRTRGTTDDVLVRHTRQPMRFATVVLALWIVLPLLQLDNDTRAFVQHIMSLALIATVAWALIALSRVLRDVVVGRYDLAIADNLQARKVRTQFDVLNRIAIAVIIVLAAATMLMTFAPIRQVGTSILASAGIIGIVVGVAAQRSIGSVIAGIQIALTQPIRLDDVVVVEGEWGRIEEIALTYVVVRIWDKRRLVLPITYFIEQPFQNWTRVTADLLATVVVFVDYTVPVDEVRQELKGILDASPHWDKQVWGLQVTDSTERTLQLRALMSAVDGPKAWDLRCEVREKLIAFLQANHPQALPRVRVDTDATAVPGEGN